MSKRKKTNSTTKEVICHFYDKDGVDYETRTIYHPFNRSIDFPEIVMRCKNVVIQCGDKESHYTVNQNNKVQAEADNIQSLINSLAA